MEYPARLAWRDLEPRAVRRADQVGLVAGRADQVAGPAEQVGPAGGVAEEEARVGAAREARRKASPRCGVWTG